MSTPTGTGRSAPGPGQEAAWVREHGAHLVDYAASHLESGRAHAAVVSALAAVRAEASPGNVTVRGRSLAVLRRDRATRPGRGERYVPGSGPGMPDASLIERVWKTSIELGAVLGPFDAWLLLRGLRTLEARVERHDRNALAVARFLEAHPRVCAVHYPWLASHPQHALARAQMRGGGGVVAVELAGGFAAAERFVASLRLFARAPSVGGVESLAVHPAAMLAGTMTAEQFAAVGVTPDLVRLSVGIEDERDLLADLAAAL